MKSSDRRYWSDDSTRFRTQIDNTTLPTTLELTVALSKFKNGTRLRKYVLSEALNARLVLPINLVTYVDLGRFEFSSENIIADETLSKTGVNADQQYRRYCQSAIYFPV